VARKESRFLKQQKVALGVFAAIIAGTVGFLFWLTIEDAPLGEFVEGEHYQLIENPRRIRSDQIEVLEFFSYGCIHCYRFDPDLVDWVESKGDIISFQRIPAIGSDYWRLLGRNYYALQQLDELDQQHMKLFRAIHDARDTFPNPESLFSYFEDIEGYEQAFRSAEVSSQITRADTLARRMKIASVPAIVIQGKYLVRASGAVGPKRMLDVMNHLIEKELAARTPPAETTAN
jgi:thiol:disulfide interchange protein DsbA